MVGSISQLPRTIAQANNARIDVMIQMWREHIAPRFESSEKPELDASNVARKVMTSIYVEGLSQGMNLPRRVALSDMLVGDVMSTWVDRSGEVVGIGFGRPHTPPEMSEYAFIGSHQFDKSSAIFGFVAWRGQWVPVLRHRFTRTTLCVQALDAWYKQERFQKTAELIEAVKGSSQFNRLMDLFKHHERTAELLPLYWRSLRFEKEMRHWNFGRGSSPHEHSNLILDGGLLTYGHSVGFLIVGAPEGVPLFIDGEPREAGAYELKSGMKFSGKTMEYLVGADGCPIPLD
jgi:hypothetical protein